MKSMIQQVTFGALIAVGVVGLPISTQKQIQTQDVVELPSISVAEYNEDQQSIIQSVLTSMDRFKPLEDAQEQTINQEPSKSSDGIIDGVILGKNVTFTLLGTFVGEAQGAIFEMKDLQSDQTQIVNRFLGDAIEGYTITSLSRLAVTLEKDNETHTIRLFDWQQHTSKGNK